jgi:hypothetical protein
MSSRIGRPPDDHSATLRAKGHRLSTGKKIYRKIDATHIVMA